MADQPTPPRRIRRYALGLVTVLLALFAVPVLATNAYALTSCGATYRVPLFWPPPPTATPGFQAEIVVTNTGSVKTTGWRINLVMPVGFVAVRSYWNATKVPGRPSDFENVSYNGVLNPGGSTTFGFIAERATPGTKMTPNQFFCTAYSLETT
jgi:cellulose binding protein with CBM2 domain